MRRSFVMLVGVSGKPWQQKKYAERLGATMNV
jgi:hypothetical protein